MNSPDSTTKLWDTVVTQLKEQLTLQQFSTWFRGVHPDVCNSQRIELSVPNGFYREWFRKKYADVIVGEVEKSTGNRPSLRIRVRDEEEGETGKEGLPPMAAAVEAVSAPPAPAPEVPLAPAASPDLNPNHTFETLVTGSANQLPVAAARAIADGRSGSFNPLLFQGDVGMGKTHILQAITARLRQRDPSLRVVHVTGEHFLNAFLTAMDRNELASFRKRFRSADILVVDDVHCLAGKERTQIEFLHTFQALINTGKQVILSVDRDPGSIAGLSSQLASCFRAGMICELEPFSLEMRREVVSRVAEREGASFPPEVLEYVAENARSGIRELIGATIRVLGTAALQETVVSLQLAQKVLGERVGVQRRRVSVDQVAEVVTEHYGVRLADLQTRRRTREVVVPRQVCMSIARRLTGCSLEAIGRYFGGRDHSTVLYALDRVEKRAEKEPEFREHLDELTRIVLTRAE